MPRGYSESGDVVYRTLDGRDLNEFWATYQESLRVANETRDALSALFMFNTTLPGAEVDQAVSGVDFEDTRRKIKGGWETSRCCVLSQRVPSGRSRGWFRECPTA
jgi:hypothetical protein